MEQIPTTANDSGMNSEDPYMITVTIEQEYIDTTEHNKDSLESTVSMTKDIVNTFGTQSMKNQFVSSCTNISHHSKFMRSLDSDKRTNSIFYKCGFCEKMFSHHSNCVTHIRIHTGEKPYQCGICEKMFSHRSNCVTHTRIHTRDKPFKCQGCGQKFSHGSNLKAHQRKHTGKKPFQCNICGKEYSSNNYLKKHIFRHAEERK